MAGKSEQGTAGPPATGIWFFRSIHRLENPDLVEAVGIDTRNLLSEFHQVYLRFATATRATRALIQVTTTNKKGLPFGNPSLFGGAATTEKTL